MEEDAARLLLGADFEHADCLLNSEVQLILESKRLELTDEAQEEQLSAVFEKTLQYVNSFNLYKGKTAVKEVRQILSGKGLHSFELAALANLCPAQVQQVRYYAYWCMWWG